MMTHKQTKQQSPNDETPSSELYYREAYLYLFNKLSDLSKEIERIQKRAEEISTAEILVKKD